MGKIYFIAEAKYGEETITSDERIAQKTLKGLPRTQKKKLKILLTSSWITWKSHLMQVK